MASTSFRAFKLATRPLCASRLYSTTAEATPLVRDKLMAGVKTAMKNKDSLQSTALRGVLSQVYASDKLKGTLPNGAVVALVRKAITQRTQTAAQYIEGNRPELAEKETREAEILESFLPPLLSAEEIEQRLRAAIAETGVTDAKGKGKVMKAFYEKTDQGDVLSKTVNEVLEKIWASKA
ncbi:GatB/YqeY domain-containing protein [Cylindrobasidium torrendii FP15055 ss-10]|uniref:Altered inheritance of mitochondria protein 41 n=1 Tax=Cylindrobasidium torrendii FP15055 ss-10 TaxID=1314674 RepID=A0A0D7AZF1_9AGAR|nr:GatB/YqeY domain-containing protein [Cylindrobasidium torrendii FP15055 ss-10]